MEKNEKLKQYAQKLRKEATKEENTLWYQYLRRYPVQFRRQCPIGNYIVDFYCAKALLVVELDGSQHYELEGIAQDAARTRYLTSLGIYVLRFSNRDINENLRGVCQVIDSAVRARYGVEGAGRKHHSTFKKRGV